MPSGPRDGTQRPRLMIELRAMPETRGNVTTENKRGERVTNEGKGNESLFSPVLSRFSRLASTPPPLRWIIRFSIARDHRFAEASRCWFIDLAAGISGVRGGKKKKKRDKTSGEGGRIVNECGSHNEKGSSSSRDSNLVSSSFLCSRGDLIVEICNAA